MTPRGDPVAEIRRFVDGKPIEIRDLRAACQTFLERAAEQERALRCAKDRHRAVAEEIVARTERLREVEAERDKLREKRCDFMHEATVARLQEALREIQRVALDGNDGVFRDALERCDAIDQLVDAVLASPEAAATEPDERDNWIAMREKARQLCEAARDHDGEARLFYIRETIKELSPLRVMAPEKERVAALPAVDAPPRTTT